MPKTPAHKWEFRARFRRRAYGWKSQPAIKRVKEAVSEIKKVARKDKILAAEGAVLFLEKVSPALEQVDSSSGMIGSAVNKAVASLVQIIAAAPADQKSREKWLERLFEAHANDDVPYIEALADDWGELCGSTEVASMWADRLLDTTRQAFSPNKDVSDFFHGTSACLSALFTAGRYDELIELLKEQGFWPYRRWAAMALAAQGKKSEAIQLAESCRKQMYNIIDIDQLCEDILLSSGLVDEAYKQYGLRANEAGTYLAWFRAVLKKYPHKKPAQVLEDLVAETPGEEGKWFAAAKDAQFFDEAIVLANRTPCSPQTLTRAARDYSEKNPAFAIKAGLTALRWLIEGYGYDITSLDVLNAYTFTMQAAQHVEYVDETIQHVRDLIAKVPLADNQVARIISKQMELRYK